MGIARTIYLYFFLAIFAGVQAEELSWTGCGISKNAYILETVKEFEHKRNVTFHVSGGGATRGIREVNSGKVDIGGTCRIWLRDVTGDISEKEADVSFFHVGWDAIIPIVNKQNPLNSISMGDLKKVFTGEIRNWNQLGGEDQRIGLITRYGKISGVGYMFRLLAFGDPTMEFKVKSLKVTSSEPLEKRVSKVSSAFALDGISSAKKANVKILSIDGIEPSKENIIDGKYKLYRPLFLTLNKQNAKPIAREFVDFVLSEEGQKIISEQGTVNLQEGKKLEKLWRERQLPLE